jgi:membrane protease YdiL (CAAX protease family)
MRTLGVWATFGWGLLAFLIANGVGSAVVIIWFPDLLPSGTSLRYGGPLVALVTLLTNPLLIALFAAIARWRTGVAAAAYLGFTRFSLRDFLVGFLAIAIFAAAADLIDPFLGVEIVPQFQTEIYGSVEATGWLVPLTLAVVVIGPMGEEVMFRGFLFRGWIRPGARGVLAIAVISLLWSLMHVQYTWVLMVQIFMIGLILGWIRWRSGSTLLTIVLHVIVNLESTIETALKLGWLGL